MPVLITLTFAAPSFGYLDCKSACDTVSDFGGEIAAELSSINSINLMVFTAGYKIMNKMIHNKIGKAKILGILSVRKICRTRVT
jgi:hypothetical protein